MRARQESCCFTGHRPGKLPWRYNEFDPRCLKPVSYTHLRAHET